MYRLVMRLITGMVVACLVGCVGVAPTGGDDDGVTPGEADGSVASEVDASVGVAAKCEVNVQVPVDASRPVDIMARATLTQVAARMPCVLDQNLRTILEGQSTMWYDHASIVPGYQDSFGDNVVAPIGMRPNTIRSNLIDLAVPGGHAQIFSSRGVFHFPFGKPLNTDDADVMVVDFWRLPSDNGSLLPVVWSFREPNGLTHRINWLFPVGTVLGEAMFIRYNGELWPFEIRTRVRGIDSWESNAYRPFRTAEELAVALEDKRTENATWMADPEISALIAHLRDNSTLQAHTISVSNFVSAFPTLTGAQDSLPGLTDPSILQALLLEQPFRSAKDAVWKSNGSLETFAATTLADFSIVPKNYNGGMFKVNDETCERCHQDAGRPFKDWYDNILAYGELWGEDESFSWHPFANNTFVDPSGAVVDFNYDNRTFRQDFLDAGVLVRYNSSSHSDSVYKAIPRSWKGYAY